LAAVLTLALGIGANTAIFSVADAFLLRPLPYPNSDRLVVVWNELSKIGVRQMALSAADFDAFSANTRIFEKAAAFREEDRNIIHRGTAGRASTISATPGLLEMLAARTATGRLFTGDEWQANRNQVVIISHSLFVRRFAANPAVIGKSILLDDRPYTLVGVLAADFKFSLGATDIDAWTPLRPVDDIRRAQFRMLARLSPGVSIQAAQAYVAATAARLKQTVRPYEGPNGEDGGYRATAISLRHQLMHDFRTGTLILMSAAALVLLIACVNVANLLLARTAAREKEVTIRRALGASRPRLIRQWLTEAALLTLLGGSAGLIGSLWGIEILKALSPAELPGIVPVGINGRALLFTFGISAITCLLFSLAPAFLAAQMTGTLRGPRRRRRVSSLLIAVEAAITLVLLISSGLLLKSFTELKRIDTGVRIGHVLTMQVELSGARYEKPRDRIHFFLELESRLARLPGVVSVGATDRLPVFTAGVDTRSGNPFSIDGSPWNPNASAPQIAHTGSVGLGYFRTLGIPLLAGRAFSNSDTLNSPPVAVINQTLARKFFTTKDPIGTRILLGAPAPGARWLRIVGVIADVRTGALDLPPMPQFYVPDAQQANSRMFLLLRTQADPLAITRAAAGVVAQIDPEQSPDHISTMEEHVNKAVGQPRFRTLLLMFFGGAALFLSAIGIYGVVAHAVVQRTNEIGIRIALGANATHVAVSVLADGLRPVAMGMLLGLAAAAVLTRLLASVLYQVKPSDPEIVSGAGLVLAVVGVLACLNPASRAVRVDPTVALKYE
jgi:putative ABC transport system permease protein